MQKLVAAGKGVGWGMGEVVTLRAFFFLSFWFLECTHSLPWEPWLDAQCTQWHVSVQISFPGGHFSPIGKFSHLIEPTGCPYISVMCDGHVWQSGAHCHQLATVAPPVVWWKAEKKTRDWDKVTGWNALFLGVHRIQTRIRPDPKTWDSAGSYIWGSGLDPDPNRFENSGSGALHPY